VVFGEKRKSSHLNQHESRGRQGQFMSLRSIFPRSEG
jgi:hypothetical protein